MKSYQDNLNIIEEQIPTTPFKASLKNLIRESYQSFSQIMECNEDSVEGQKRVLILAGQLRKKIDSFCAINQENQEEAHEQKDNHVEVIKLRSLLRNEKKKKKRFQFFCVLLLISLSISGGLTSYLTSVKPDDSRSSSLVDQFSQLQTQLSFDAQITRFQLFGNQQSRSDQEESRFLLNKMHTLLANHTINFDEYKQKVKNCSGMDTLLNGFYRDKITPLLTKIQGDLDEIRKQMVQHSGEHHQKGINASLDSLSSEIQRMVQSSKSEKNQSSAMNTGRVEEKIQSLSEKVNHTFERLSKQANEVIDEIKNLKKVKGCADSENKTPGKEESHVKEENMSSVSKINSEDLSLKVDVVHKLLEKGLVGNFWTSLAIKSEKSFLMGSMYRGLKLVDNGRLIYSGKLFYGNTMLLDMIFIEYFNFYLIQFSRNLYRKDIDKRTPYHYMTVNSGNTVGSCLRYSTLHQRLIINKDSKTISVINLQNKKLEIEVQKTVGDDIKDFRVFGELENKVIAGTKDGYIILYSLNYFQKTGSMISHLRINLISERKEEIISLSVCGKNRYVLVEIGQSKDPGVGSRMVVLKFSEDSLVKMATIDPYSQKLGEKLTLGCYGYVGTHVRWIGLSRNENGVAQVYDYDTESGEFQEFEDKRVSHQERSPVKMNKLEGKFYYTGWGGKVMRLEVNK